MKTKYEKLDIINMIDDVFILEHGVLWSYTVHYGKLMIYTLFISLCCFCFQMSIQCCSQPITNYANCFLVGDEINVLAIWC